MDGCMTITTKQGDNGRTHLLSGEEVSKDSPLIQLLGDLDELCSVLGVARTIADGDVSSALRTVQKELVELAGVVAGASKTGDARILMDESMVAAMEERIAKLERGIVMPDHFIIQGDHAHSAYLDYARAVARRCERRAVQVFNSEYEMNARVLIWLNRLSDYLWLQARRVER